MKITQKFSSFIDICKHRQQVNSNSSMCARKRYRLCLHMVVLFKWVPTRNGFKCFVMQTESRFWLKAIFRLFYECDKKGKYFPTLFAFVYLRSDVLMKSGIALEQGIITMLIKILWFTKLPLCLLQTFSLH